MDRDKVMKEVKGWTFTILAVLLFRTFLYEAVYIPSGSMIPTLQIGDYVVVEKWAYGARLPFTESAQFTWASPRRGDIVVLLPPPGSERGDDLIKRVVALGGDVVDVVEGRLVVNREPVPRREVPGDCTYWNKDERAPWRLESCRQWEEQLDGHLYRTHCAPDRGCDPVVPVVLPHVVPEGHVFLMGDHRDRSQDSRYFGDVPVGRIKGRAWMALASWGPQGPRWDRLFHGVKH